MQVKTKMTGSFWGNYQNIVAENVIPYQWKALNNELLDVEPSDSIKHFRLAAGIEDGEYHGLIFQDSDVYKWLESVAYSLDNKADTNLENKVDELIDLIAQAQLEDGYLNTYYQVKAGLDKRWTNVRDDHELYCAGHLIEAAVAYYQVTGKRKLLEVACKFADHIDEVFGTDEGKLKGYPGHEEIELALIRLYLVTEEKRYLDLALFFVDERGQEPLYFDLEAQASGMGDQNWWHGNHEYSQAHLPVRQQKEAVGHVVRAMYLYSAVTDLAQLTNDESLKKTVEILWDNVVNHKMSINGGLGASSWGESFAENDDLPNDTAYNETCASIGLAFWAKRMLQLQPKATYADVLENTIYNGCLCGMDLQGERFLYVNPLQVDGSKANKRHDHRHVTPKRQKWFNCACCPPNLARLIGSFGDYMYSLTKDTVYINLFSQSLTELNINGQELTIEQVTNYPWDGRIEFNFKADSDISSTIAIRIPQWANSYTLEVNGEAITFEVQDGYAVIDRHWENEDKVVLNLDMSPRRVYANLNIIEDIGKVAVMRGPLVYVAEEVDNGSRLGTVWLSEGEIEENVAENLLEGTVLLTIPAKQLSDQTQDAYTQEKPTLVEKELTLIPYFLWGNRGYGEIRVWLNTNF